MTYQESETVELKQIVTEDIKKEVIAFANTKGGKLYIGIANDGTILGLDNADSTSTQISNMIRDAIKPDLTMFVHYETHTEEDKTILVVDVQRGTERPYYLTRKGLRPEGVYVRQGFSSAPASETAIRNMIKETDGESFEAMRSLEQDLTFQSTEQEFKSCNVAFEAQQFKTLKLVGTDSIYTNLGLLLSDQCLHTIKVAVFQGTDQTEFIDRQEFSGSLLQQLQAIHTYLDRYNQIKSTFKKLQRVDTKDYPEIAIREALLNLLVHRDYSFSASALIGVYSDRMEFISIGGLIPGIELQDILLGVSVPRNQHLANIFYRLQLIEAYGAGIKKIMNAYKQAFTQPTIETSANAFKITLPNINTHKQPASRQLADSTYSKSAIYSTSISFSKEEALILKHLKKYQVITRQEAETLVQASTSTAIRMLRNMLSQGLIVQKGNGKNTRYCLP